MLTSRRVRATRPPSQTTFTTTLYYFLLQKISPIVLGIVQFFKQHQLKDLALKLAQVKTVKGYKAGHRNPYNVSKTTIV